MRLTYPTALILAAILAAPHDASAASETTGTTPQGAAWRIAVPDGWQPGDGLVLFQHGFNFDLDTDPDLGPLRDQVLADGYAIAASGYRQSGWALFTAVDDNVELLQIFEAQHGDAGPLVAAGGSMGGLVSLKLAEDPRLREQTEGVLAFCPVADGVAAWDQAFDLRIAYDAICEPADGGDLPTGAEPTPWALDLDDIPDDLDDPSGDIAGALFGVAACTGLGLPEEIRSDAMKGRLAALHAVAETHGDNDSLIQQLGYAVFGLSDLVRAPDKLNGANPFFNQARVDGALRTVDYEFPVDEALPDDLNERIARVTRDDFVRARFHDSSSLDGSANARIVSLHTSADAVVPVWHQHMVLSRYFDASPLIGVAVTDDPEHCGFTAAEIASGWAVLRDTLAAADAPAPNVQTLQQACNELGDDADCRFDAEASAAITPHGARVRTTRRDVLDTWQMPVSGLWTNSQFPAQGLVLEELDYPVGTAVGESRVAVYWYTWAPEGATPAGPRWIVGVGHNFENTVVVEEMREVTGGAFPVGPNPLLQHPLWGRLEISFSDNPAVLRYQGPQGWGSGERTLNHLFASGWALPPGIEFSPPPPGDFRRIGTYGIPIQPGQGWVLSQSNDTTLLTWFTFDTDGKPMWLFGLDDRPSDGLSFSMQRAVEGGTFESGATPAPPALQPWGTVTLEATACDVTRVRWQPQTDGYAEGSAEVVRITAPWLKYGNRNCAQ